MSYYRRADTAGATYFFTVVTYRRQAILCDERVRQALRDAWVLLPDHVHCLWTLPPGDADFSMRWSMIKRQVSVTCSSLYKHPEWINPSKRKHRESTFWQRRYWEHRIRGESDLRRHVDYIHYNPVKHGLCQRAVEWPHSTFHRYVAQGAYSADWGGVETGSEVETFGDDLSACAQTACPPYLATEGLSGR